MPQIERLSVGLLKYDKANECSTVFVARKDLFTRVHSTHLCFIDPTCEAVSIPCRISVGTIFCGISCSAMSGWLGFGLRLETWEPGWTLLPSASEICQGLLKCGCNQEKDCWGQCWCVRANMLCTALRKCGGDCDCDMFCVPRNEMNRALCIYRLNWAKRTSWWWWDDWDDTVLQTQDSKFDPWRSEAEHATSRSRSLPTILTFTRGWGRNNFVSFNRRDREPNPGLKGSGANHYPRAPALCT